MRPRISNLFPAAAACLFLLAALPLCFAQTSPFDTILADLNKNEGFTDEEIESLRRGDAVLKVLDASEKREIAMIGAVVLPYEIELARKGFRRTIRSERRDASKAYGNFSASPAVSDLEELVFDEAELRDLAECEVGGCKWNLSEEIIRRLKAEVVWEIQKAPDNASRILKDEIVRYIRRYEEAGDGALMVYRDTKRPMNVGSEFEALLKDLSWIDRHSPEFASYVRSFPAGRLEGTDSDFDWSVVKIGFKPVLIVNHTLSGGFSGSEFEQDLAVSKQIYANHFLDSSLGITALVGFTGPDGKRGTILLFVNRTRASALGGTLGGLIKGIVEDQAKGKLRTLLADTKKYTSLAAANLEPVPEIPDAPGPADIVLSVWVLVPAAVIAVGLVIFVLLRRRSR